MNDLTPLTEDELEWAARPTFSDTICVRTVIASMIAIAVDELRQLRRREIIVESPAGFAVNPRYCDGAMLTEKCCGYSHVQDATELVDFFNQEHYRKFMVFFNLQMNPDSIKRNL